MEQRCGRAHRATENTESKNKSTLASKELLQKAIDERDRFLENNPKLKSYQEEIDQLLDNSGNQRGRMAVLGMLMQGKLMELQKELCTLSGILISNPPSE